MLNLIATDRLGAFVRSWVPLKYLKRGITPNKKQHCHLFLCRKNVLTFTIFIKKNEWLNNKLDEKLQFKKKNIFRRRIKIMKSFNKNQLNGLHWKRKTFIKKKTQNDFDFLEY